jgi:predicted dinucleotide-binding enzyme
MNRNIAILFGVLAASGSALADDITIDTTPFKSTATRAEVRAELDTFKQSRVNPWSMQYNPLAQFRSTRTRADVVAEFVGAREQVAAFNGEDSGSAYLARHDDGDAVAVPVAGQPRNPQ